MRLPNSSVVCPLASLALFTAALTGCECEPRSEHHVVRRDPQPFLGSSDAIGVRRVPPRDNGDPGLLDLMERAIGDDDGPIAYLGKRAESDQRFGPLEKRLQAVDEEPFEARETGPAREALQKMGASYLLVSTLDPVISPWPDTNLTKIRHLLRDGVSPPGFNPVAVGRAHILYQIGPTFAPTAEQRASITNYIRARLAGAENPPDLDAPDVASARAHDDVVRVQVYLRVPDASCNRGRAIGRRLGEGPSLRDALDDAISQHRRRWDRNRRRGSCERTLPEELERAMDGLLVHVEVFHRVAPISDRTRERLYYLLELGIEGAYVKRGSRFQAISPNRTIYRAVATERHLVERLGRWYDQPDDTWRDEDLEFGRFESVSWLELAPGEQPTPLYRGVPLITVPSINREEVVTALVEGARFLARNQTDEGEYRYIYRPLRREDERWVSENNIVRHSLCPMVVAKAHRLQPDPELARSAKRGIDFTLSHLVHEGNRCAIEYRASEDERPNRKMGTVAAMVMSILELGRSENIEEYREELECLANQILAMQEPSGQFTHYDVPRGHPFYGRHNTIYPGELMLALSELYNWSHDERYRAAFDRALRFQQNWFRTTRQQTTEDGIYPDRRRQDLIAFEPWGLMALNDMHRQTGDSRYVDFAFELVEFMDGRFHWDFGRAQYADYLGGYFKTQLELPAINSCGYTEGAGAAYMIALRAGRNIEERRASLLLGIRFVLQLQYRRDRSLFYLPDAATAEGGFRYNLSYSRVRNDYMYHAMNALALAAFSLREEDYPPNVTFEDIPEVIQPAFAEEQ